MPCSSKVFSRSRKIVTEQDLCPLLKAVIGAPVCINVAIALIDPTPLMKHKEFWLIGWADHFTLISTNRFHDENRK